MDELKQLFNNIINKSVIHDLDTNIEIIENNSEIKVIIDHAIPTDDRPNRRSSRLMFLYTKEFLEDHSNISADTPADVILKIINDCDFSAITHSRYERRFEFTYVIQTNGIIVAQKS